MDFKFKESKNYDTMQLGNQTQIDMLLMVTIPMIENAKMECIVGLPLGAKTESWEHMLWWGIILYRSADLLGPCRLLAPTWPPLDWTNWATNLSMGTNRVAT